MRNSWRLHTVLFVHIQHVHTPMSTDHKYHTTATFSCAPERVLTLSILGGIGRLV